MAEARALQARSSDFFFFYMYKYTSTIKMLNSYFFGKRKWILIFIVFNRKGRLKQTGLPVVSYNEKNKNVVFVRYKLNYGYFCELSCSSSTNYMTNGSDIPFSLENCQVL